MGLVEHAKTELERAGLFDQDSEYGGLLAKSVMKLVKVFAAEGHSGMSAPMALEIFSRVASWKTLTTITSDPTEWHDVSETIGCPMWQNIRQSSCFSTDGGASYYDIDDPKREVIKTPAPVRRGLR